MKSKKAHLFILLIAAVVVVSGCAAQEQANIVKTSFEKAAALENGAGYSAEYKMSVQLKPNEGFKSAISKSPQGASAQSLLDMNLNFKAAESVGNSGKSSKTYLDMTDFVTFQSKALEISNKNLPPEFAGALTKSVPKKLVVEIYTENNQKTICLDLGKEYLANIGLSIDSDSVCIKGTESELVKLPTIGSFANQARQYSSYSPDKLISTFSTLYNKGVLSIGGVKQETAAGRSCNTVPITIKDLTKLTNEEILDILAGASSATNNQQSTFSEQLANASATILKQLIKNLQYDMCFDSEHGVIQKLYTVAKADYTDMLKSGAAQAKAMAKGDPERLKKIEEQEKQLPEDMSMEIIVNLEATSFRSPSAASDYTLSSGTKIYTVNEIWNLLNTEDTSEKVLA